MKSIKNSFSSNKNWQNIKNSIPNLTLNTNLLKSKSESAKIKRSSNKKFIKQRLYDINMELEKKIYKKFKNKYSNDENFYNKKVINEIICNENTHIVSEFKDYLIKEDNLEFLHKIYTIENCMQCLPKIFEYYENSSVIFPNYIILPESKYIYNNIQKKQKIIDDQQELKYEKEKKLFSNYNHNLIDDLIFNDKAIDSILNQTDTSGVKRFFGLNNNENDISNTFDDVVKMIEKAEKEKIKKINKVKNNYKNISKNNSNLKGRNNKKLINEISNYKNNNISSLNKNKNLLNNSNKVNIRKNKINKDDKKYNNNTIYISSYTHNNKNNKPLLINNLLSNNVNNKNINNITMKAIEEKKLVNNNKYYKTKVNNNKKSILNQNKNLSNSNSNLTLKKNKLFFSQISFQNYKQIIHKKIKSSDFNDSKKTPLTCREKFSTKNEIMKNFSDKIRNKTLSNSIKNNNSSINKKHLNQDLEKKININKKPLKTKLNKKKNKSIEIPNSKSNKIYISVTHRNYNHHFSINKNNILNNQIITNSNLCKTDRLNSEEQKENLDLMINRKLSDEKIIKNDNILFNSSNNDNTIKNHVKKNIIIRGIKINGFDDLINKNLINEKTTCNNSLSKNQSSRNYTSSNSIYNELCKSSKKKNK